MLRSSMMCSAALGLSLLSAPGMAQDQAAGAASAEGTQGRAASGEIAGTSDIVVTALKQSTSLQKTPAAVSVLSSEDLVKRQVADIRSLGTFVPSLRTNAESTATQFFLRGVGKQYDLSRVPEAVSLVVDGLSIPQHASGMSLFDISSIEVLPGPQGTLYGSAAIGGVINVNTTRPSDKLETSLLLEAGNYDTYHVTASQNVPLTPDWSIRAVFNGFYHDAYYSNGTGTDNSTAFRLSSLYEPAGGNLSFFLSGMYGVNKGRLAPLGIPFPFQTSDPYVVPEFDSATAFFYPPNGLRTDVGKVNWNIGTVTGRLDWTPGDVTISYIGGYLHRGAPYPMIANPGGFLQYWDQKINLFNNELRFAGPDDARFRWISGLFQSYSKTHEFLIFGPNLAGADYDVLMKTYAAYAQGTYSVTDRTRLTAGLRVSQDQVSSHGGVVIFPTGFPPNFGRGTIPVDFGRKWKRLNWKVGAEQDIGRASMFYAAVQSGFNPGTFDGNAPFPNTEVKPQSMMSYTAGLKNRFLDSILTVNVEGFYYKYKNQIISVADLATGLSRLLNARRSRIYGLQVDTSLEPTRDTRIHANVAYLNAKFQDFIAGNPPVQYGGLTLPFAPKFTANIGASQRVDLGDSGSLDFRVDTYVSSKFHFSYDHPAGFEQGGYTKTDASITYQPASGRWQLGAWCKNLENDPIAGAGAVTPNRPYPGVVVIDPPRTCGGRFSIKFGE